MIVAKVLVTKLIVFIFMYTVYQANKNAALLYKRYIICILNKSFIRK